jgi:hypothetical protein
VGAADAKAQIATFIYAIHAMRKAGIALDGQISLAFVVDEESGACSPYGTQYLLEQGLLHGNAAIIGEPGNKIIAIGHRGLYRFRLTIFGEVIFPRFDGVVECGKASLEKRRRLCLNHNPPLPLSLRTKPCSWLDPVGSRKLRLHENWAYRIVPCILGASNQLIMEVMPFLEKAIRLRWKKKITASNENWSECSRSVIS